MDVRAELKGLPSWLSIEQYYADDERRTRSGEMDFGCWWLSGNIGRTTHRISAVEDTGEFYVVRLSRGVMDEPPGEVFLAGAFAVGDYEDAERVMGGSTESTDGWAQACGQKDSLAWALERLRASREEHTL